MTNNEILNNAYSAEEAIVNIPMEHQKTHEGKAFSYNAKITLVANTPAYRGFSVGTEPLHLKSLDIIASDEDITVEVSEAPTYTGGTAVSPIARNRKTTLQDFRDNPTINYNTPTALENQPIYGVPTIRRVINNGNILNSEIAVAINDLFGSYGLQVNDVDQVDEEQGLQIAYQSKQVRTVVKQETITTYTADTLKIFANQSYDEGAPVIKAVYNDNTVPLVLTTDYTIDQDGSNDWGITILSTSETVDPLKNIIVVYEIEEEYIASHTQSVATVEYGYQKLAIGTVTGTFTVGEVVIGGTSNATGTLEKIVSGLMYLSDVEGVFKDAETVTGDDSEATVALTDDPVSFGWYAFETQSYDDSAITATVANGTRNSVVEYLSFTQDYTFALDTTYKITIKDTSKTDESLPTIVIYQINALISEGDGLIVYSSPTVTAQGTVIETYYLPGSSGIGQQRNETGLSDTWELILRPDTKYLIKVLSSVAQDILIKYRWYLEG